MEKDGGAYDICSSTCLSSSRKGGDVASQKTRQGTTSYFRAQTHCVGWRQRLRAPPRYVPILHKVPHIIISMGGCCDRAGPEQAGYGAILTHPTTKTHQAFGSWLLTPPAAARRDEVGSDQVTGENGAVGSGCCKHQLARCYHGDGWKNGFALC